MLRLAVLAVVLYVTSLSGVHAGSVIHATEETFDTLIGGDDSAFVMFHAPWCGHCKRLAPHVERLGETVSEDLPVKIVMVDATKETKLGNRFGVNGFPTLFWFDAGDREGERLTTVERTYEGLSGLVEMRAAVSLESFPDSRLIVAEPDKVIDMIYANNRTVVALFGKPTCPPCARIRKVFHKLSAMYAGDESIDFLYVSDHAAHIRDYGVKARIRFSPLVQIYPSRLKNDEPGDQEDYRRMLFREYRGYDVEHVLNFISDFTGMRRDESTGLLDDTAGKIEPLAKLAAQARRLDVRTDMVAALQQVHENDNHGGLYSRAADYYLHVADKLRSDGDTFVDAERGRLSAVLAGKMSRGARDWLTVRKNVLETF